MRLDIARDTRTFSAEAQAYLCISDREAGTSHSLPHHTLSVAASRASMCVPNKWTADQSRGSQMLVLLISVMSRELTLPDFSFFLSSKKPPVSDQNYSVYLGREWGTEGAQEAVPSQGIEDPTWIQEGRRVRLAADSNPEGSGGSGRMGRGLSRESFPPSCIQPFTIFLHTNYVPGPVSSDKDKEMKGMELSLPSVRQIDIHSFIPQVFVVYLLCASIC